MNHDLPEAQLEPYPHWIRALVWIGAFLFGGVFWILVIWGCVS
jgi:hypothetical protein